QPNVDQYQKWDERSASEIRSNIGGLVSAAAREHPDLILWPESSMPDWLDAPENARWLHGLFKRNQSYQLIGALTRAGVMQYNSAVLFDPAGKRIGEYRKRRLVPFGEYVPLRVVSSKLIGILGQMGDLDPGPWRQDPLPTPLGRLGVTICFEAMFPVLNRLNAAVGADILTNLTND